MQHTQHVIKIDISLSMNTNIRTSLRCKTGDYSHHIRPLFISLHNSVVRGTQKSYSSKTKDIVLKYYSGENESDQYEKY